MKEQILYVTEAGVLMLNVCDIVYGIQYFEYETLQNQVYWLHCPVWFYDRYN